MILATRESLSSRKHHHEQRIHPCNFSATMAGLLTLMSDEKSRSKCSGPQSTSKLCTAVYHLPRSHQGSLVPAPGPFHIGHLVNYDLFLPSHGVGYRRTIVLTRTSGCSSRSHGAFLSQFNLTLPTEKREAIMIANVSPWRISLECTPEICSYYTSRVHFSRR